MTEQLITIEDLDNILCKKTHVSVVLELVAKYYNCTPNELIKSYTKRFVHRGNFVFTLRYFGASYNTIQEVTGLSHELISDSYRGIKSTYFKEQKTIDLFLFVLHGVRKYNQHA